MMVVIYAPYLIVGLDAHLGPFQLVLLGTILEGTILVFELPTGIVADAISRRASIIIGFALLGVSTVLVGTVPHFGWIVVGDVLAGLGYTFTSGADVAWITDEVGEEPAARLYLRSRRQWAQAAGIVAYRHRSVAGDGAVGAAVRGCRGSERSPCGVPGVVDAREQLHAPAGEGHQAADFVRRGVEAKPWCRQGPPGAVLLHSSPSPPCTAHQPRDSIACTPFTSSKAHTCRPSGALTECCGGASSMLAVRSLRSAQLNSSSGGWRRPARVVPPKHSP